MSILIRRALMAAPVVGAGALHMHLTKDRPLPPGVIYHGTTMGENGRFPLKQEGDVIDVVNSLFITAQKELALAYATGGAVSIYRAQDAEEGRAEGVPVILVLRPLREEDSISRLGLFGFHSYIPHGKKVVIEQIIYPAVDSTDKDVQASLQMEIQKGMEESHF